MKTSRHFSACFALLITLLTFTLAYGDSLVLDGTVINDKTVQVYAPIGGTVDQIYVSAGDSIKEGQPIAALRTTKVYATENGTVTAVFGQTGDSVDSVTSRYGAVVYLEGESTFTVSASTANAYNSTETKFVHVGETVYLQGRSSASRSGSGIITGVDGTSYTIEVDDGTFIVGDSVDVFRDSAYTTQLRIGRGTVARRNPLAVSGSGSIVSFSVKQGDSVRRGDLLFETLDGSFDGLYMSGTEIVSTTDGTLSELKITAGSSVQKGAVAAVIYPAASMRITAEVPEEDLDSLHVGDPVTIELTADEDAGTTYSGTVSMISQIASSSQNDSVTFTVYMDFEADSHVRYGMSALVSTPEDDSAYSSIKDTAEETRDEETPEEAVKDHLENPDDEKMNHRQGRGDDKFVNQNENND